MIDTINISDMFIETHESYIKTYKNNNGTIKKHASQNRYLELLQFVSNSSYWARHNLDVYNTEKLKINNHNSMQSYVYKKNCISGKYLNEIHLFFVKFNFYKILYKKLIMIYLSITNYETLKNLSIDSSFSRNILGKSLKRNPHYNNKTGLKIHAIVDSNRVPISIFISDGCMNDSITLTDLFDNLFIDKSILESHTESILADSSYSSIINIRDLTNMGFNIMMGRNTQHTKKNKYIKNASDDIIKKYKIRGVSENFFGNIQRYPCILNNYERTIKSYSGLLLFVMSSMLSKKINIIISEHNDIKLKKERDVLNLKKKEHYENKKRQKYKEYEKNEKIKEYNNTIRKKRSLDIENKIKVIIRDKLNKKLIIKSHEKNMKNEKIKNTIEKSHNRNIINKQSKKIIKKKCDKNIKKDNHKKKTYSNYEIHIINEIYQYIKNDYLTHTYRYKFGKKYLFMISSKKYVFKNENIIEIMKHVDQKQIIDRLEKIFFL